MIWKIPPAPSLLKVQMHKLFFSDMLSIDYSRAVRKTFCRYRLSTGHELTLTSKLILQQN